MQSSKSDPAGDALKCAACGEHNPPARIFCHRCTAPLNVAGLHELDSSDAALCAAALLQLVNRAHATTEAPELPCAEPWRAYLSAFWLRPETALVLLGEYLAIHSLHLPAGPWLDLGCGDGLHAAIYSGWRFADTFDAFQSLDLRAADIYHHWDPGQFDRAIITPGRPIDLAVDIKPTAVQRARALGVFGTVLQADATALPVASASVAVIFSNMLRDLGQPLPSALDECRRILRDDGRLLISAMTPHYPPSLYFLPAARTAEAAGDADAARQLLRLDRGRSIFCQRQLTVEQWEQLLAPHGLTIDSVQPVAGAAAMRFWDVGLRPFSTTLLAWRDQWLRSGQLPAIKSAALDLLQRAMAPFVRQLNGGPLCMHLLSVRKR